MRFKRSKSKKGSRLLSLRSATVLSEKEPNSKDFSSSSVRSPRRQLSRRRKFKLKKTLRSRRKLAKSVRSERRRNANSKSNSMRKDLSKCSRITLYQIRPSCEFATTLRILCSMLSRK